jgi:hypothetical protein
MEYIFLGDEIGLSTRVEKCFEKTRTRRMWDCVVVVKPQTLRKGKMLLEVSLPLPNVVSMWGLVYKMILLTTPCLLVSNVSSPNDYIVVTEGFNKSRVCESRSSKTKE